MRRRMPAYAREAKLQSLAIQPNQGVSRGDSSSKHRIIGDHFCTDMIGAEMRTGAIAFLPGSANHGAGKRTKR